jgi:hypothetical protein
LLCLFALAILAVLSVLAILAILAIYSFSLQVQEVLLCLMCGMRVACPLGTVNLKSLSNEQSREWEWRRQENGITVNRSTSRRVMEHFLKRGSFSGMIWD